MNTSKQINAMVLVLFLTLIAVGAYSIWDPFRSNDAKGNQDEKTADFGGQTFALNCRLCHGDRGQGGQAGGRLSAAPQLDRPDLQGIDKGNFSQVTFNTALRLVTNTITCGRAGTAMPTWGASQGGTLNDEQIRQLVTLITEGRWALAQEHADEIDAEATMHATIQMANGLAAGDGELVVSNAGPFTNGQYIRVDDERLRVLPKQVDVERGVDGTTAADHKRGTQVLKDGAPIIRNPTPVLRNGAVVFMGGAVEALAEDVAKDGTSLPVGDASGLAAGDVLQLEDEHVRVTGVSQGLPSTGVALVKAIGRTPKDLSISTTAGINVGDTVRIGNELLVVQSVRDDAASGIELTASLAPGATEVGVSDPSFLRKGYVFRVGDELVKVIAPVETGQLLGETIGTAETTFSISGSEGVAQGDVIRMDDEQLRVKQIVQPAKIEIQRQVDGSTAVSHTAGTAALKSLAAGASENPETGQSLVADLSADGTTASVSGTAKLSVDQKYKLGDEVVQIKDITPAVITVQRAVGGTKKAVHARRAPVYAGDLIEVQRALNGTKTAAHNDGDKLLLAQMKVKRAVDKSQLEAHGKNDEIFAGNRLNVGRGVKGTQPADHKEGVLVRNFPTAPDSPAITGAGGVNICGQYAQEQPTAPSGPTPTSAPNATQVTVGLGSSSVEFVVTVDTGSVSAGAVAFNVTNNGTTGHNFRVIKTELDPANLPQANLRVDEAQLPPVGGFTAPLLQPGASQTVPLDLAPGKYVLLCNVPTHYGSGMHVAFEVK